MSTFKEWIIEQYDTDKMKDIVESGCISGCAPELVYYSDTSAIFNKYEEEIWQRLQKEAEDACYENTMAYLKNRADFNRIDSNQQFKNFMVWLFTEITCEDVLTERFLSGNKK